MKQSLSLSIVFVVICCLGDMNIKDSVEQITLDLVQNCVVPEVSVNFEVDLNDNAVARSRYERFARAQSSGVPLKELSHVKLR